MTAHLYQEVQVVLGDRDEPFSREVSSAFFMRGLRDFAVCRDADELREAVTPVVDVVLYDVDLPGIDSCAVTQDIRQERLGSNPFAVLIAMARPSSEADLARVIKCGVDDFQSKPMEADHVVRRVDFFARKRDPFVITQSYVGPSRRELRREDGSDDDLAEVPNTLRAKIVEGLHFAEIQRRLDEGRAKAEEKKAGASLRIMARLTQRLVLLRAELDKAGDVARTLRQIAEKSDEVVAEHDGSKATGHIAAIAARVGRLARQAADNPNRSRGVEIRLLAELSDAAVGAYATAAGSAEIAQEITAVVDRYLARG